MQDVDNNKALEVRIRASTSKVRRGRHVICHSDNIIKIMDEWRSESDCDKDDDLIFYSAVSLAKGQQQVDLSLAFKKFLKSIKTDKNQVKKNMIPRKMTKVKCPKVTIGMKKRKIEIIIKTRKDMDKMEVRMRGVTLMM